MVNWRPAWPPEIGLRMMKIRPGIEMSAEKRKNQFRFPTTSNTRSRLAADHRPAGTAGHELVLGHAEQTSLARPVLGHEHAQDRAGHGDRGEHRDEDAEDQHE